MTFGANCAVGLGTLEARSVVLLGPGAGDAYALSVRDIIILYFILFQ